MQASGPGHMQSSTHSRVREERKICGHPLVGLTSEPCPPSPNPPFLAPGAERKSCMMTGLCVQRGWMSGPSE